MRWSALRDWKPIFVFLLVFCLMIPAGFAAASTLSTLSLSGPWRFELDPKGEGIDAQWFRTSLPDRIELPGSLQQRGFGTKNTTPSVGRLTPKYKYEGLAWYQQDVVIPEAWRGKQIDVFLERCLWESHAWLDDKPLGMQNSLSAPHLYRAGKIEPGHHVLTICVDNRYRLPIGTWISALSDDTQGRWNGLIGRLELQAHDPIWVYDLQAYPDVSRLTVKIKGKIGNGTHAAGKGVVKTRLMLAGGKENASKAESTPVEWTTGGGSFEAEIPLSDAGTKPQLWAEFSPRLYQIEAGVDESELTTKVSFGFRQLSIKDRQILSNGQPVLMRGTVDECVYPLTAYPPMDKNGWLRVLKICKAHGFNYMRFHSWCPPEAAFEAGDALGMSFQVELPFWTIDAPQFGQVPERDQFVRDELDRILDTYGNHPSFALMAMGNESGGNLDQLVSQGRARDARHLYRCERGTDEAHGDYVEVGLRGVYGPRTDWDRTLTAGNRPDVTVPTFLHETGQWGIYPDFDQIAKFKGVMRPDNFESYRQSLQAHGMLDQDKAFSQASGLLSVLLYKEEAEASLRTWPLGGFQLLEARDYPGQGTALVGWLDSFWDSKGLITPEQFRRFSGPVVPLLRMPRRVWTNSESFEGQVEVSNFGPDVLESELKWSLTDEKGVVLAKGNLLSQRLERGRLNEVGTISVALSGIQKAARVTVRVALAKNPSIENSWDIWVYPAQLPAPVQGEQVRVVHEFDAQTRAYLQAGDRVLLFSSPKQRQNAVPGSFMPVFWDTRLFNQTGTLGILCDPRHPALAEFPNDGHSDWQWADLLGRFSAADSLHIAGAPAAEYQAMDTAARDVSDRSKAIILDGTPATFRPIVQVIDNYDRNHKLGAIFEMKIGSGSLLVCALDLEVDQESRPAARQLYRSLLDYVGGKSFQPTQQFTADEVEHLLQ